jgi:hypothetical protein
LVTLVSIAFPIGLIQLRLLDSASIYQRLGKNAVNYLEVGKMVGAVFQIFPGQSSVWFTVFFWFLVILGYSCFNSFPNRIDSIASVGLGINLLETGKMPLII